MRIALDTERFAVGLQRHLFLAVCLLLAALTAVVAWLVWKMDASPPPATAQTAVPAFTETLRRYRTQPGPWGELEYTRIAIARPDTYVYIAVADSADSRWRFSGQSLEDVERALDQAALTSDQKRWLLDPERCQKHDYGWVITPGAVFILGLPSATREKLYALLGESDLNPYHSMPLSWRADGLEEWLEDGGLSPQTIDLVQRLIYKRGNAVCFSDMPAALAQIPSEDEKKRLIKTLSRNNTLLMKLRVPYGADVSPLVDYWSKGGRAKDIRPLLESLAQVPGGASVDVAHLLPPIPRSHLYTYEYPSPLGTVSSANCFWTAMNFFNAVPDDRFADVNETLLCLATDYTIVDGPSAFGDVLMLEKPGRGFIHAAVYIADGVVFTKNGHHHTQPWLLMRLDDLLARYPSATPVRVVRFRSKAIWEGASPAARPS